MAQYKCSVPTNTITKIQQKSATSSFYFTMKNYLLARQIFLWPKIIDMVFIFWRKKINTRIKALMSTFKPIFSKTNNLLWISYMQTQIQSVIYYYLFLSYFFSEGKKRRERTVHFSTFVIHHIAKFLLDLPGDSSCFLLEKSLTEPSFLLRRLRNVESWSWKI